MINAKGICWYDRKKDFWGKWTHQREEKYYRAVGYFIVHSFWWSWAKTNKTSDWFRLSDNQNTYGSQDQGDTFQEKEDKRTWGIWRLLTKSGAGYRTQGANFQSPQPSTCKLLPVTILVYITQYDKHH